MENMVFAAIDKQIINTIPQLTETESRGKGFINYGADNQYPEYLYGLYNDVSTLKTIIEGTSDFVAGDDATCTIQGFETELNRKGDTVQDIVKLLGRDWLLYGSYALQVIRDKGGNIREIYYVDMRNIRSDKYNEAFYYSEEYSKKYSRTDKTLVYPKYIKENVNIPASIVFVKNTQTTTYAVPRYSGAIKSCEIERHIDELHLGGLSNGFMGSYLINFLNGKPTDEEKSEIEKEITEKFCSSSNAGRIVLNFADNKDNAAQLEKLDVADFSDKYKAAAERSREQIYCSFGAVPQIFGLSNDATGFNEQEYAQAFRLYNRTVVKPIQKRIAQTFDKIFGVDGSINIVPFSVDDNNTEKTVE